MGLTQREVKERQAQGLVNDFTASASTSTWQIIKRNVFTLFNALNFVIALALAFVQAWSNLVFFAVICFNAFSGIVTELRAKHMVDKLNLMTKEKVKTIRDGQEVDLDPEELVLGDVIRLSAGEQIPSDARVLEGFADITAEDFENIVIAYEPVWAIGTGLTATPEQADEACGIIRSVVAGLYGGAVAEGLTIQYGGSMNEKNAAELLAKENVDGGLIGGASLVPEKFAAIVDAAQA